MNIVKKEFTFIAAHRLEGDTKCNRLHGHNYKIEVQISGPIDDSMGWVIDFGKISVIMEPLLFRLDHRYIGSASNVAAKDPLLDRDDCVLLDISHSTAEQLAMWFEDQIHMSLASPYTVHEVTVWETPKAGATYAR